MPAPGVSTTGLIGESQTQKGLWPPSRGLGEGLADGAKGDCGHHDAYIIFHCEGLVWP